MAKFNVEFRNTSIAQTYFNIYRGRDVDVVRAKVENDLRDWFNVPSRALPAHIKIVNITPMETK